MAPLLAQGQRADRAFERLYRRHVGDVYRYALAVLHNQADAEDVTQTTFMNAYRAFQRGERPEKPHNWLIAIAHNVCRQRFRQSARRPVEVSFDDDVAAALVETEDAPTGEDIRRALSHLAFSQRAALVMRELEGRSYAEIAAILEISTGAVETLLFRARRALREQLESALTCSDAELAISKQLDGRLPRAAKGALRAHLRECPECATFARRQRAQRTALRSLAAIPVPPWLGSLFGGGGASVGTGLAVKAAVAVTAGVAIGGAGYVGVHEAVTSHHRPAAANASTSVRQKPAPIRRTVVIGGAAAAAALERARSIATRRAADHPKHAAKARHKQVVRSHRRHAAVAAVHRHTKRAHAKHVKPARRHARHVSRPHRHVTRAPTPSPRHRRPLPRPHGNKHAPRLLKPHPPKRTNHAIEHGPAANGAANGNANGHAK